MKNEIRAIRITKEYETPIPPVTRKRGPIKKGGSGNGPIARINRNKRLAELKKERNTNYDG